MVFTHRSVERKVNLLNFINPKHTHKIVDNMYKNPPDLTVRFLVSGTRTGTAELLRLHSSWIGD